ncbi:hypothetical protein ACP4OV_010760 [Aristida adscensionis]
MKEPKPGAASSYSALARILAACASQYPAARSSTAPSVQNIMGHA